MRFANSCVFVHLTSKKQPTDQVHYTYNNEAIFFFPMSIEIGAIKIKDGFFIGDIYASKDIEFVVLNKITRIVNCAAREIPNIFEIEGILYIPFDWVQGKEQEFLLDKTKIDQAIDFLNTSIQLGESILIHSVRCQNRAVFMCACYLVRQYKLNQSRFCWTANTAINFIYSRKEMPRMKPQLEKLVVEFERIEAQSNGTQAIYQELKSIIWSAEQIRRNISTFTAEEIVLANTFLNTYPQEFKLSSKRNNSQKIQWNDKGNANRSSSGFKNRLCTSYIPAYEQLVFIKPILQDATFFKPILKGSQTKFLQQNLLDNHNIQNIPQQRASSANPINLSRTQKMRESSSKKLRFNKVVAEKQNKDLESEFYETVSFEKRNTLQINMNANKPQKRESSSGSNFYNNKSSSKDKKLQAMLSTSKSKMNPYYGKLGVYAPYRSQKSFKTYNKSMKKIASTKMIRPHSGNNAIITSGPTPSQVKSFMQGLMRLQQQDEFHK